MKELLGHKPYSILKKEDGNVDLLLEGNKLLSFGSSLFMQINAHEIVDMLNGAYRFGVAKTLGSVDINVGLVDAIGKVEQNHFRTEHDTGANGNALVIINFFRKQAGLPAISKQDLPKWNGQTYVKPENSKLLPKT